VLNVIKDSGMKLNLKKCCFAVKEMEFLGFKAYNGKMELKVTQRNMVLTLKEPENVSELRSVFGVLTFFKRFIHGFEVKASVLLERLKKGNFKLRKQKELIYKT
jgi:hypothetical protein